MLNDIVFCERCGSPMSYQSEDADGHCHQFVCDGPNDNTDKRGCYNYQEAKEPCGCGREH